MKHKATLLIGLCASAVCTTPGFAQGNKVYLGVDAGGALTRDTTVKEFYGPVAPGTKVELDPGFRIGFVGGYRFTDYLSVEGETGFMGNNIRSITGATIDGDAMLSNVPFLANVRLQIPTHCKFKPYIGAGAGGSASIISLEHHIDLGGVRMTGSDSTIVFAYQAFAGVSYQINEHMSVDVGYHYFATTAPTWKADSTIGTLTDKLRFGGAETHAFTASFEYRF